MICGHCTPPLANESEVGIALGISRQAVKKLLASGEVESVQRGKFVFVTRDELVRYSLVRQARLRESIDELRKFAEVLDMEP